MFLEFSATLVMESVALSKYFAQNILFLLNYTN